MSVYERFLNEQLVHIADRVLQKYPYVGFEDREDYRLLKDMQLYFLVALSGTGKSTTLNEIESIYPNSSCSLPTRREIADWVVIPLMQSILKRESRPVTDRAERFYLTREFARLYPEGFALIYQWIRVDSRCPALLFSDGIRGQNEVMSALNYSSLWRVYELWTDPLIRLQRLSNRGDPFDETSQSFHLEYLPDVLQEQIRQAKGIQVSDQALAIMMEEARNYGWEALRIDHAQFKHIDTQGLTPVAVAQRIVG